MHHGFENTVFQVCVSWVLACLGRSIEPRDVPTVIEPARSTKFVLCEVDQLVRQRMDNLHERVANDTGNGTDVRRSIAVATKREQRVGIVDDLGVGYSLTSFETTLQLFPHDFTLVTTELFVESFAHILGNRPSVRGRDVLGPFAPRHNSIPVVRVL